MSRILCTGGTGFIGYWVNRTNPRTTNNIWFLNHSSYDNIDWDHYEYDYIIHSANVDPTRVIDCANKNNARILYISSGRVYNKVPKEYELNKIKWENELSMSGVNFSSARLFNCCGLRQKRKDSILYSYISNALNCKPIQIWGDGTLIRSYIYGLDMGEWLWKILLNGKKDESYDVASYRAVSTFELARIVNQNLGNKVSINILNRDYYEGFPIYLPVNIQKTLDLGLDINIDLETTISRSIFDYETDLDE